MISFLDLMRADHVPLGIFVKIPAPEIAEMVALVGFEFVVIDAEHSMLGPRELYSMLAHYEALGLSALVRLPSHDAGEAQRVLDAGASGLLFPHVADPGEAARLVSATTFPPHGTRGMGYASRAGRWGLLPGGRDEYLGSGDAVARVAMVEDGSAVETLDGIAATSGIGALFVGPSDLSLSLGLVPGSDEIKSTVGDVIRRAAELRIPVGTTTTNAVEAARLVGEGCTFLVISNDTGFLARAMSSAIGSVRERLAEGTSS